MADDIFHDGPGDASIFHDSAEEPEGPSALEAFARGGSQGILLNHRDELVGVLETALDRLRGIKDTSYEQHRDESRAADAKAQESQGLAYGAGSLTGGLATMAIPGMAEGGLLAQAGKLGALGAVAGAGNAQTLEEIPAEAAKEGVGGALAGAGGIIAGRAIGAIGRRAAPSLQRVANAATNRAAGQTGATLKGVSDSERAGMAEMLREGKFVEPTDTVGHVSDKLIAARQATNEAIGDALSQVDREAGRLVSEPVQLPGVKGRPAGERTFVAEPPPRSPVNGEPTYSERVTYGRPEKVQVGGARPGQVDATDYEALGGYKAPRVVEAPADPGIPGATYGGGIPQSATTDAEVAKALRGVLDKAGENVAVSDAAGNYISGVIRKLEARNGQMSLKELSSTLHDIGGMVNWNVAEQMAPGANTIAADAYGALRQHMIDRATAVNPALGKKVADLYEFSGHVTPLAIQAEARAGQLEGQQPFGLSGRVGLVAGVSTMAAGSPLAGLALIAAGFAHKGLEQRGNALAGHALNKLAKAVNNPATMAKLGRMGAYVASAAQRGPAALAAAHYTASQIDSQYAAGARAVMNEPSTSGKDDVLAGAPPLDTSTPVREP